MLLINSAHEYILVARGIPIITHAAELTELVGKRVKIGAEIEYTGIHGQYIELGRGKPRTDIWHLYIIKFEDAPVAF